jgi:hypothetical protein
MDVFGTYLRSSYIILFFLYKWDVKNDRVAFIHKQYSAYTTIGRANAT